MLTTGSWAFMATLGEVFNIAEVASLKLYVAPHWYTVAHPELHIEVCKQHERNSYFMFQDSQTGGGGCRVVFMLPRPPLLANSATTHVGVAWISRHGGYPQADITTEVSQLFDMVGCKPYNGAISYPHS